MILFTIKLSIFFIILIYLVDRLIFFFKENLTIPKTKDLVNLTPKKYEEMLNTIKNNKKEETADEPLTNNNSNSNNHMKEELTSFLKKQLKKNQDSQGNLRNDEMMEPYFENNKTMNFSLL